uniref:Large ribosomal subunit protein uL23c n=1 Tax=Pedobesia claviformis TaxID=2364088 RepID=A0A386B0U8_9CHLO|nr:ribosomal protein L23 [Pedobesia claviformis]AYC65319.1 ribosomal protein L23 [Pedobesia claviformis]
MLKHYLFTEKTTLLLESNKYVFDIYPYLNKNHIRLLFQQNYQLRLKKINTYTLNRKSVNKLTSRGYKKLTKRVIISLMNKKKLSDQFYF